ncbi:ABC transporter, ATP-binding protein [Paenibacillus sp. oral taxon 786 str. D14]|uniref:ABC transporter ATP-binding protein n=1 Tax=Paenibacillus sp. oral taxon 786 TaxID=652715 RepID=UPI0001AFDB07|nr:ABC transporter ATP-binding protein [Paenibacillus sp. oral taxon 786]EES73189.1 ABC transporter, ATP-binding protein [Paenibacillus sp. oral taxon 786 str. D14]
MEPIIEMKDVSKSFKDKKAVDHLSFTISKGTITAILGPNGAGKTTAVSMLLGLLEPTTGTIKLFGKPPKDRSVRERTGAMLQEVSVMDRLKVREILELIRSYYPNPMAMDELVRLTGLSDSDLNRYAEKLSGGQKRSLSFALALAGNPELVFFDEPTVGLDITARRRFWDSIRKLAAQGKTIVFTTHYLQEADDIADRILLFNRGSLVADGTPEAIKSRIVKRSISFLADGDGPELRSRLLALSPVAECYNKDGRIHVTTEDTDAALAALFTAGLPVHDIQIEQGRLDEAFEQLTTNHEEEAI